MRVRAVVFDVYGTLFDVSDVATALATLTEQSDELSRLWRAKQLEYSFVRTLLNDYVPFDRISEQALGYALALHGLEASAAQRADLLHAWQRLPLYPNVLAALGALRAAGIPLLILSNGARRDLAALLETAGCAGYFSAVLSSEDAGVYKPHPAIYQLVLDRLGAPAADLLFVSSNGFDIAGARRFGFTVARVNRTGQPLDLLGAEPHLTVADLLEVAAFVHLDRG